eukprot:2278067-Pyramimonas_sp.AAC.1
MTTEGLQRGRQWCLHRRRQHVDLWRELWRLLEDHGGLSSDLTIRYAKAHQTAEESFLHDGKK